MFKPVPAKKKTLRATITCLHCWQKFAPEEVLWISEHTDLLGDPRLGDEASLRFLPNRFDISGNAVDARGQVCRDIACPNCHLSLPRTVHHRAPIFVSILGTPSCGKSYYFAGLVGTLRRDLPRLFNLRLTDADMVSNQILLNYEENLFHNEREDELLPLADLIAKTDPVGGLYNEVSYGNQRVRYPRPHSFNIEATSDHEAFEQPGSRVLLTMYDNAGENFQAGNDSFETPATRHVAEASWLMFLFDPTQDPRFHSAARKLVPDIEIPKTPNRGKQETVLNEVAARLRRIRGVPDGEKHDRPLFVVINKVDVWKRLLKGTEWKLPIRTSENGVNALHYTKIKKYSDVMRKFLLDSIPELVYAAEGFCDRVYYLPASSLGVAPTMVDKGDENPVACVKPSDIKPVLISIPFCLGLTLTTRLIPMWKSA